MVAFQLLQSLINSIQLNIQNSVYQLEAVLSAETSLVTDDSTISTKQAKLQALAQVMHIHCCCTKPLSLCTTVETKHKQTTPNYQTMHSKGCSAILHSSVGSSAEAVACNWFAIQPILSNRHHLAVEVHVTRYLG